MAKAKKKYDEGGILVGRSHAEGGIPFTVNGSGQKIEVEGREAVISSKAFEDKTVHTYKGTNWEILDQINTKYGGNSLHEKVESIGVGDFIICISSVEDPTVREISGTNEQVISAINESGGCVSVKKGAEVKEILDGRRKKKMGQGGVVDDELYAKWKHLVNMSASELRAFYDSEEGKKAGLTASEARKQGIGSGRQSARWILRMKDTPKSEWTPEMWNWAGRQVSFISRMSGNKGDLYDDKGRKTRKHLSLLIWGHNPKKKKSGGIPYNIHREFNEYVDKLPNYGYHGTQSESIDRPRASEGRYGKGFYLTPSPEAAEGFGREGNINGHRVLNKYDSANVFEFDLRGLNLKYFKRAEDMPYIEFDELNKKHYDGVYFYNEGEIVIFNIDKLSSGKVFHSKNEPSLLKYKSGGSIEGIPSENKGGDCYKVAGQCALNENFDVKDFDYVGIPYVVHGEVQGQGAISHLRYGHAWVEDDVFVYDYSNGREIILPKVIYYRIGRIDTKNPNKYRRYTFEEARKKMLDTGIYGAWDVETEYKKGGLTIAQTPAPLKDRIKGSKVNPKESASSSKTASSIVLSDDVINSIKGIIEKHNDSHPNKKITLSVAKAVVRRGMGAYSSSHRPTISDGKPNSRVAWGLARLNAFVFKAQHGYSKSGKYSQDNDLFDELGINHRKFEDGGEVKTYYTRTYADGTSQKFSVEDYEKNVLPNLGEGGAIYLAPNGKPSNLNPEQYKLVRTPQFKAWFGDWENDPANASKVVDENGEPLVVYRGMPKKRKVGNVFRYNVNMFSKRDTERQKNDFAFYFTDLKIVAERYGKGYASDYDVEDDYVVKEYFLNIRNLFEAFTEKNQITFTFKNLYDLATKNQTIYRRDLDGNIEIDFKGNPKLLYDYSNFKWLYLDGYQEGRYTYEFFTDWSKYDGNQYFWANLLQEYMKYDGVVFYESSYNDKWNEKKRKKEPEFNKEFSKTYGAFYPEQIKLADGTNTTFDGSNPDIRYKEGGNITYGVDEIYEIATQKFIDSGYDVSQGSNSKTDYGHSRYFYVNQNGEVNDNLGLGFQVRVSDHSFGNRRIMNGEQSIYNKEDIMVVFNRINFWFHPEEYKNEYVVNKKEVEIEVLENDLKPTDLIISERIAKSGNKLFTIKRTYLIEGVVPTHIHSGFKMPFKQINPEVMYKQGGDILKGGKADGMTLGDIAKHHKVSMDVLMKQYNKGIKHELEHTSNKAVASEIAKDHIFERLDYYDMLDKAEKTYAHGGIVKYYDNYDEHRLARPSGSIEKKFLDRVHYNPSEFVGNFGWKASNGKFGDGYLMKLDEYDRNLVKDVRLKQGEVIFRYFTHSSALSGISPMIKINLDKGLLYFPVFNELDDIEFETRGVKAEFIGLIASKLAKGGKMDWSTYYSDGGHVGNPPKRFLDSKGERKIDPKTISELTKYVNALPQTKSFYFDESTGKYTPERRKLHVDIINSYKKDLVCIQNDSPIAILMGGSPASGKSTFLKKYSPYLLQSEIFKIDADDIRSKLPEYKGWNAAQTHLETKDIVNTIISDRNVGIPCDFDIIYDGTMNNTKSYEPLIQLLKSRGYKIYIVYIDRVPKEVVENRALSRYRKSGRFVPLEVIDDFFSRGKGAFEKLKGEVDGWMLVDGSDTNYNIIGEGGMKLPQNRTYSVLGRKITEEEIPDEYARGGGVERGIRPSPHLSATIFPEGYKEKGGDGYTWEIVIDKNGTHRWKRIPNTYGQSYSSEITPKPSAPKVSILNNVASITEPKDLGKAIKLAFKEKYNIDLDRTAYIKSVKGLDGSYYEVSTYKSKAIIPNEFRKEIVQIAYNKPLNEMNIRDLDNIHYGNIGVYSVTVLGKHWKRWLEANFTQIAPTPTTQEEAVVVTEVVVKPNEFQIDGGDLSFDGKLVPSFNAFKQSGVKVSYKGFVFSPYYDDETGDWVYCENDDKNPVIFTMREAYETFLENQRSIKFSELTPKRKNGLLLGKQNLLEQ